MIGSLVQNAVGMLVESGPYASARNNGVIEVNGMAEGQPRENIGMLVVDYGSGGQVGNGKASTININGYNSTGLNVIAHAGSSAKAYSRGALSQIKARGGSFTSDDAAKATNLGSGWSTLNFHKTQWALTDNIKLAHSTINLDTGSTLFAVDNRCCRSEPAIRWF